MRLAGKIAMTLTFLLCQLFVTARAELAMPSGAELLAACEHASQHGYDNPRGMLCIWYVTPCDCTVTNSPAFPRVCLPPDVDHEMLAQQVMQALRERSELREIGAEEAAAIILSDDYPCG